MRQPLGVVAVYQESETGAILVAFSEIIDRYSQVVFFGWHVTEDKLIFFGVIATPHVCANENAVGVILTNSAVARKGGGGL